MVGGGFLEPGEDITWRISIQSSCTEEVVSEMGVPPFRGMHNDTGFFILLCSPRSPHSLS